MTQRPRRPAVALLAAAVLAASALGCGEGDGSPTGVSGEADTVAASPAGPITEEQARAFAAAVNLRASDLPYAEPAPDENEAEERDVEERARDFGRKFNRCVGGGVDPERRVGSLDSGLFESSVAGGYHSFESSVEVMPRASLTARQNAGYRSLRGHSCLSWLMPKFLEEVTAGTPGLGRMKMTSLPVPLPGLEGSFGFRFSTTVTVGGASPQMTSHSPAARPAATPPIPFFIDQFVFVSGPAEINLTAAGAPRPIPTRLERNLLRVLQRRAEANRLPAP